MGIEDKNDYLELARISFANSLAWHSTIEAAFKKHQVHGTSPRNKSGKYEMTHYQDDAFTWLRPRNELAARGRYTNQEFLYYMLRFSLGDDDKIDRLAWTHDADVPDGGIFDKENPDKRAINI